MQHERAPQPTPQEIRVTTMQQALTELLHELPTPITITKHQDPKRQHTYYTYQVGEQTAEHPHGLAMGATPQFLDAVKFSLHAALSHNVSKNNKP